MKPQMYQLSISPSCQRVYPVLAAKNVAYEPIEVDISKRARPEAFERVSPFSQVPVFVHGDDVIIGSANIAEYIDERWPEPGLMPKSPGQRAYARQWLQYADREIQDRQVQMVHIQKDREKKHELVVEVFEVLSHLERELEGKTELFLGPDLSLVDCLFAPTLVHLHIWARLTGDTKLAGYTNILSYVERLKANPILAETVFQVPSSVYEQYYSAVLEHGMTFPME